MKRIVKGVLALLVTSIFIVGCDDSQLFTQSAGPALDDFAPVDLSVQVDDIVAGNKETLALENWGTKSAVDDDGISSEVNNIIVIQFDGNTDESKAIAVQYISDMSSFMLSLIPTEAPTTIVCIANSFRPSLIQVGATLGELKRRSRRVHSNQDQEDNILPYAQGLVSDEAAGKYFCMSFATQMRIYSDRENRLEVRLKRNLAKVTLNLQNNWSGSTLSMVTFKNVLHESFYFTNRTDLPTLFPEVDEVFHYVPQEIAVSAGQPTQSLTFYVPVNMRGTSAEATPETKPMYCQGNATYVTIFADEADGTYSYDFFLGKDLTSDYNLEANKHYTYNLTFTGKGDLGVDQRIKDVSVVDYTIEKDANCYIINPLYEREQVYYIPIESRIQEYWENYISPAQMGLAAKPEDWQYEVLWYDNNSNPIAGDAGELSSSQICIEPVTRNDVQALKITVGRGFTNWGNVLVGVREIKDGKLLNLLWSWHLWITDYDPDCYDYTKVPGVYNYTVPGGEIQRFKGAMWGEPTDVDEHITEAIYEDKFIMDRNLGARNNPINIPVVTDLTGGLHYQYGRKDPFPAAQIHYANGFGTKGGPIIKNLTEALAMSESVIAPTTFFKFGKYWCNDASPELSVWNDKYINQGTTDKKSIFDPCPLGWRLPLTGAFNHFVYGHNAFDHYPLFLWTGSGRTYSVANAFFPCMGKRAWNTGKLDLYFGQHWGGYYWTSSAVFSSNGLDVFALMLKKADDVKPAYQHQLFSSGYSIRPIQE